MSNEMTRETDLQNHIYLVKKGKTSTTTKKDNSDHFQQLEKISNLSNKNGKIYSVLIKIKNIPIKIIIFSYCSHLKTNTKITKTSKWKI